jgi:diguanylate cyclase (GGDEF)-like protein
MGDQSSESSAMNRSEESAPVIEVDQSDGRKEYASLPVTTGRPGDKTLTSMDFGEFDLVPPPTKRDRPVLVRLDSIEAGRLFVMERPELRVGRMTGNDVVIDDAGISREHARLFLDGDVYRIEDLGSSNGTYVNGVRVDTGDVTEGAVIQFGPKARFRFSIIDRHQESMLRQLYESAIRDPLTGVYNRAYFVERLGSELAFAKRHATEVSLLLLDLDHFKRINDTFGHLAGDWVLKCFTAVVYKSLRSEDLLARFGGEEFLVLLRGISISGASRAAERLRNAVAAMNVEHEGRKIPVTVSVGCASMNCAGVDSAKVLVAVADRRLYVAKRGGRNAVVATD